MKALLSLLSVAAFWSSDAAAQDMTAISSALDKWGTASGPGCSIAASRDGVRLVDRSFGVASLEYGTPITSETRFDIASVSKQFTAAAVLLLVQDGKLSLTDDVRTHIPELADTGSTMTLDHLLTHTSGLRDYPFLTELQGWWPETRRQHTNDELVALIAAQQELNFEPGTRWSYSNSNYLLAAEVVERVSGMSLREFLAQRVFGPLGMNSTVVRDDYTTVIPHQAGGYFGPPAALMRAVPASRYGDSNVVSTAQDLVTWTEALAAGRLGGLVTRELQRPGRTNAGRPLNYARGLFVDQYKGFKEISHSGGSLGATAFAALYPDQNLSVAIVCNARMPVDEIVHELADLFLPAAGTQGTPSAGAEQRVTLSAQELQALSGVYFDDQRGTHVRLTVANDLLAWGNERATPLSATRFTVSGVTPREFLFEDGALIIRDLGTGDQRQLRRVEVQPPSPADLETLSGDYRSSELVTTYSVRPQGVGIMLSIKDGPSLDWPIEAISRDLFDAGRDTLRFLRDADGRIVAFAISNARNREIRFDRID